MPSTQFSVDTEDQEGFYVIVADQLTVYESYDTAVEEVQQKISTDADSVLAEVTIDKDGSDDMAVSLEQISWQRIIRDMTAKKEEEPAQ